MSIYSIIATSDDALANQFEVTIPAFPGSTDNVGSSLRVTNFTVPSKEIGTYEVHYKTQKFTKPSGKIETGNEISFTFRADKYWNIYNGFKAWLETIGNHSTGIMSPDYFGGTSGIRIPVVVTSVDSSGTATGGLWTFEGCWISSIGDVGFDVTSGDPLECDITLQYIQLV